MKTDKINDGKLGLVALVAMCVGSMIGSGLFALPQNVAVSTGVVGLLVAWSVTFVGMICLAKVFQNLSDDCPQLDAGVYAYAKEGLGDYLGFSSAWGYWISAWIGNVGYMIILCKSLALFFPVFGTGADFNLPSLILGSCVVWGVTFLCILGIKSASIVNVVVTIAKVIPIAIFIAVMACFFDGRVFTKDVWQVNELGSVMSQIKNMMLVTVWVFIGIEGANVFSARARKRSDVGRATLIGFLAVFLILFAVSTLPFGILGQQGLASLRDPSTGELMRLTAGDWGSALMSLGLVVSVIGALLSWILIAAEVPFIASTKDGLFPKVFATTNKVGSPVGALIITGICQQLYLIFAYFNDAGYLATILLSSSMILLPYLFSALYAMKVAGGNMKKVAAAKDCSCSGSGCNIRISQAMVVATVASVYGVWLVYAAGIKYLLLSSLIYVVGGIIYIANRLNRRQQVFNDRERVQFLLFVSLGVLCMILLAIGKLTIG